MAPVQSKPVAPGLKPKPKPKQKPTTRATALKAQKAKASSSEVPAAEDSEAESVPQGDNKAGSPEKRGKLATKEEEGGEDDGGGKGGRRPGAFGYSDEMCEYLCNLVEERLPLGAAGWDLLAAVYNKKFFKQQRDGAKLKKKFLAMANINPIPTGNRPIDKIHRHAIELKSLLSTSVNSISIDDQVVPSVDNTDEEGQGEDEEANVSSPLEWSTSDEDKFKLQNDGSGLSIEVMDPPQKTDVPLKTPKTKSKIATGSKLKGKHRQIEPFPLSALGTLNVKSKSSKVLVANDDSSSGPEILDNPVETTTGTKRKAEDQDAFVVRKKPVSSIANSPAKGTAVRRQQMADSMADRFMERTDPTRFEEISKARQQSATDTALLLTCEGQIADLQRDMGALRDSKDAQIANLQRDIGNLRDAKDATITGLQSEMGKLRDLHEQEVRQLRNRHEQDMRTTRDQYERELRNERDSRHKAENGLTKARSLNMIYGVINGQSNTGTGNLLATLGAGFGARPGVDPSPSLSNRQVPINPDRSNNTLVDGDGAYIPVNPEVVPQSSNTGSAQDNTNSTRI